jgi:hypothetical protein
MSSEIFLTYNKEWLIMQWAMSCDSIFNVLSRKNILFLTKVDYETTERIASLN